MDQGDTFDFGDFFGVDAEFVGQDPGEKADSKGVFSGGAMVATQLHEHRLDGGSALGGARVRVLEKHGKRAETKGDRRPRARLGNNKPCCLCDRPQLRGLRNLGGAPRGVSCRTAWLTSAAARAALQLPKRCRTVCIEGQSPA